MLDEIRALSQYQKMVLFFLMYLCFVGYLLLAKVIEILNLLKKGEAKL